MELKLGLLLLLCLHTALPFGFDDIETIFDITEKTVSTLSKAPEIAELVNHANKDSEIKLPFSKTRRQLIPMFKKFAEVTRIVKKIDGDLIASNMQTISQLQKDLPIAFRFELKLDAIEDTITLIELYYQNFLSYTDQAQEHYKESNQIDSNTQTSTSQPAPNIKFDKYTLENFATSLTSHVPTSVRGLMERINEMIVPSSRDTVRIFMREGIFQTVVKTFNVRLYIYLKIAHVVPLYLQLLRD
ncbi:hypothetical protein M8J77_018812 [Diaphorina citri]|nr:hypothetical protein M8J77_018812 [Diaphorina citri]